MYGENAGRDLCVLCKTKFVSELRLKLRHLPHLHRQICFEIAVRHRCRRCVLLQHVVTVAPATIQAESEIGDDLA